MLKVLLVDDERFIVQGLEILIDWKAEGFEIAATASNGQEALDYLKTNTVDLIITDVMMPVMTGLELLENIQKDHISEASFIVLSGYGEFAFAQQALRYGCIDYLLKPIEEADLLAILRKFSHMSEDAKLEEQYENAYLARNIIALLFGKHDSIDLDYIKKHMRLSGGMRYIEIEVGNLTEEDEEGELRALQRELYQACLQILQEDSAYCVFDVSQDRTSYGVGFIYCDHMAEKKNCTEDQYIKQLQKNLGVSMQRDVHLLAGKKVADIAMLSGSYETACTLKTLSAFSNQRSLYFYEEELQEQHEKIALCKDHLDALILAIEQNEPDKIRKKVEKLYREMHRRSMTRNGINLNINYLLFQLVHLASNLNSEANQADILHLISTGSFEEGGSRGSREHLSWFACEYAEYLSQLRKKAPVGILGEIEREIWENYAENLTLQDLGKKYYINSSYLGQIFRKKYGQTFKNYLTNYRINEASKQLLNTDKRVRQIAEDVGYKDIDYFINKFIELKGCTPTRFRKDRG